MRNLTFFGTVFFLFACSQNIESSSIEQHGENPQVSESQSDQITCSFSNDTILHFAYLDTNDIDVIVRIPEGEIIGTIMALPGWNYPNTHWCDSTSLCDKALEQGYAMLFPQMGKSNYCSQNYPETRKDWLHYPTRTWVVESMIPEIQKSGLLDENDPNFILGLSTGARGAMLIGLDLNRMWDGIAVLSGVFDQSQFPNDNLYIGFYGQMNLFPERWEVHDNAIHMLDRLRAPVYIGHGRLDPVVDLKHSQILADRLKLQNRNYEFHIDENARHDYDYWDSEVDAMLEFFEKNR